MVQADKRLSKLALQFGFWMLFRTLLQSAARHSRACKIFLAIVVLSNKAGKLYIYI